jgi:hypothetical protein
MDKLSLSRAWDETKMVLARDGRLFIAVALALFVLPGIVLDVVLPTARSPGELPPMGPWMVVAAIALLVSVVGQLAVVRLSMGPHISVGEAIVHGARRLVPYIAAVLAWALPVLVVCSALAALLKANPDHPSAAAALALIAAALIGIFLWVRLMLAWAVASAEEGGPVAILQRSWNLSRGNWWRLFAFVVLFAIGAFCLVYAVEVVFGLVARTMFGELEPLTLGTLLVAIVSQLVSAVIWVLFFVMVARIYLQRSGARPGQPSVPSSGT